MSYDEIIPPALPVKDADRPSNQPNSSAGDAVRHMMNISSELTALQIKWKDTMDKISYISALLIEASLEIESRLVQLENCIPLQVVLTAICDTFKSILEPLWKSNHDFLQIYSELDVLYDYLLRIAKSKKYQDVNGVKVMYQAQEKLDQIIARPNDDQGNYSGEFYKESILQGQTIIKKLKDDCDHLTAYYAKNHQEINADEISRFRSSVKDICSEVLRITNGHRDVVQRWVFSAVNDIEILLIKVQENLEEITTM